MKKRLLTALLAVCMTVTTIGMDAQAYYQEETSQQNAAEAMEDDNIGQKEAEEIEKADINLTDAEEITEETNLSDTEETAEETNPGNTEETAEDMKSVGTEETPEETNPSNTEETPEDTKPVITEEVKEVTQENKEIEKKSRDNSQQQAVLNYILMEKERLETPDTQNVVASLGQVGSVIADAKLTYQNETTGAEFTVDAVNAVQDMVRFSIDFSEAAQSGSYVLKSIAYTENGIEKNLPLSQVEMNVRFGVNTAVETEPDDVLINEDMLKEVEANVVTIDGNGNTVSENTVENILNQPQAAFSSRSRAISGSTERGAKNLVVVLDPGHDDTHAGAQYYGVGEEDLVLKIAKYCRDELKKYSGITVYMVRDSGGCPYAGTVGSSADCNARRVEFAASKKADIYVSFHLNASTSSVPGGVGVYYPNSSYRPDIGQEGKELATEIYQKLNALGLSLWAGGALIRNSQDGTTYPDGSLSDYLGVIRRSKLAGIPAVLIEHAFLSSYSDYMNFLSSDAKLKKLGVADANAIVSYYGLKKTSAVLSISSVQSQVEEKLKVSWKTVSGASSYQVYRSTKKDSGYSRIATVKSGKEYIDSKVQTGKRYYYKVRAVYSGSSVGSFSQPVSGIALQKAQLNDIKSTSTGKMQLSWKKIPGATGYYIYRSDKRDGTYEIVKKITSGSTITAIDTVPKNNVTYYYRVRGKGSSSGSGTISSIKYAVSLAKSQFTSAPAVSSNQIELNWEKVAGASGYRIYRSTKKNGTYTKIKTVTSGKTLSYDDKGVKPKTTYYYKIRAVRSGGPTTVFGSYSVPYSGKTPAKTAITSLTPKSGSEIELKWKKVPSAYGYQISRSTSKSGTYKKIAVVKGENSVKYQDKKLSNGKKYYYKVATLNKVNGKIGSSGYSSYKSAETLKKTDIVSVHSRYSNSLEVKWKKVPGTYAYKVKRSTSKKGKYVTVAMVKGANNVVHKDKSLKSGKTYYYKVEVVKRTKGINRYSGSSKEVSGKCLPKPESISVKAGEKKQITLNWKKVDGASNYQIARSTSKNGSYQVLANLKKSTSVKYTDKNIKPGKTYYYKVRACKTSKKTGYSSYSQVVKAKAPKK